MHSHTHTHHTIALRHIFAAVGTRNSMNISLSNLHFLLQITNYNLLQCNIVVCLPSMTMIVSTYQPFFFSLYVVYSTRQSITCPLLICLSLHDNGYFRINFKTWRFPYFPLKTDKSFNFPHFKWAKKKYLKKWSGLYFLWLSVLPLYK